MKTAIHFDYSLVSCYSYLYFQAASQATYSSTPVTGPMGDAPHKRPLEDGG